jgi:hypothetical protein
MRLWAARGALGAVSQGRSATVPPSGIGNAPIYHKKIILLLNYCKNMALSGQIFASVILFETIIWRIIRINGKKRANVRFFPCIQGRCFNTNGFEAAPNVITGIIWEMA